MEKANITLWIVTVTSAVLGDHWADFDSVFLKLGRISDLVFSN
jgi:uncharacterized membrane-anchored protein